MPEGEKEANDYLDEIVEEEADQVDAETAREQEAARVKRTRQKRGKGTGAALKMEDRLRRAGALPPGR